MFLIDYLLSNDSFDHYFNSYLIFYSTTHLNGGPNGQGPMPGKGQQGHFDNQSANVGGGNIQTNFQDASKKNNG